MPVFAVCALVYVRSSMLYSASIIGRRRPVVVSDYCVVNRRLMTTTMMNVVRFDSGVHRFASFTRITQRDEHTRADISAACYSRSLLFIEYVRASTYIISKVILITHRIGVGVGVLVSRVARFCLFRMYHEKRYDESINCPHRLSPTIIVDNFSTKRHSLFIFLSVTPSSFTKRLSLRRRIYPSSCLCVRIRRTGCHSIWHFANPVDSLSKY